MPPGPTIAPPRTAAVANIELPYRRPRLASRAVWSPVVIMSAPAWHPQKLYAPRLPLASAPWFSSVPSSRSPVPPRNFRCLAVASLVGTPSAPTCCRLQCPEAIPVVPVGSPAVGVPLPAVALLTSLPLLVQQFRKEVQQCNMS